MDLHGAVDAPYATAIVPQMVMMGLGMGFISTPATESILQVLPPARAGVGSAVNDATRELGGTLGVAVVGLDVLERVRRPPRRRRLVPASRRCAGRGRGVVGAATSIGAGRRSSPRPYRTRSWAASTPPA